MWLESVPLYHICFVVQRYAPYICIVNVYKDAYIALELLYYIFIAKTRNNTLRAKVIALKIYKQVDCWFGRIYNINVMCCSNFKIVTYRKHVLILQRNMVLKCCILFSLKLWLYWSQSQNFQEKSRSFFFFLVRTLFVSIKFLIKEIHTNV